MADLDPKVEAAALRICMAMFGGPAMGGTMETARSQQKFNNPAWQQAVEYARAALDDTQ